MIGGKNGPGAARNLLRGRILPLCLGAGVLLGACTFEERVEGNGGEAGPGGPPAEAAADTSSRDPATAVLQVVRTFREATAVGDLSLALALTDRDASFSDELVGELPPGHTRGELLLELRRRLADGLRLREESAEVMLGEGLAVVFSELVLEEGAGSEWSVNGSARETVVLVPVAEGWRIRHLHRSMPTTP